MTKEQEIQALRDFVATLPRSSYLALMFSEALPAIERDIIADLIPTPHQSTRAARQALDEIRTEITRARAELTDRISEAHEACNNLAHARKQLAEIADHAREIAQSAQHYAKH